MIFLPDFFAEIRKIELEMKDLVQRVRGAGYEAGPHIRISFRCWISTRKMAVLWW